MKPFRYGVEKHNDYWEVYKFYAEDTRGVYVGNVNDKETVELLLQAPAMRRLMDDQRKFGVVGSPKMALAPRSYTHRTLRDYTHAFVEFFRRL